MKKSKLIILFIFGFICTINLGFSQEKLIGKYIRKDGSLAVQDIGSNYSFKLDNTFTQTDFLHLGYKELFEGKYKLVKNHLILYYIPNIQKEKDYKFVEKRKIEVKNGGNYLLSKIKLIHKELLKPSVNLLIYDNNGKLLMGFESDEKGEFPFLSLYDSKIGYFLFSSLDYRGVKIFASELFGYNSIIDIELKKTQTILSQSNDTIKYIVNSFSNKKIELKNSKTKEKVILFKTN